MVRKRGTGRGGSSGPLLLAAALLLAASICLALTLSGDTAGPSRGTAAPVVPGGLFAPGSVWNRPLAAGTKRSPRSDGYVAELVRQVEAFGPWINTDEYSTPVYRVESGQPRVPVTLRPIGGGGATAALRAALASVPLPADAHPARGTDHHLVVWQPSTGEMWEFWVLQRELGGWTAAFGGAMRNVAANPGYYNPDAWPGAGDDWGATATSLPLLAGLMTIAELHARRIEHALALAIPEPSPEFVWPAQRSDGFSTSVDAIPEGTMFRLPAALDLAALDLPPTTLAIARAAQRFGMIVRDRSGTVSLYGEAPTGGDPYREIFEGMYPNALLERFPWSELEAVEPDPVAAAGLQVSPPYPLWAVPRP